MTRVTALLDANILYPAPLRDIFLQLAVTIMFGLLFATLLTLLFIPVIYTIFFRVRVAH